MIYWIAAVVNSSLIKGLDRKVTVTVNIVGVSKVVTDFTL